MRIGENENLLRYLILSLTFKGGLILLGLRYLSFYREYIIIKELGIPFYKSRFCLILVLEIGLFLIFNSQLDIILVLPVSSLFSAFSTYGFLYIFQLINSFSIWDSILSEKILDKFYLNTKYNIHLKSISKK